MKNHIKDSINKVSELQERKLLKETLNYVFEGMIDYTEQMYDQIQKRVCSEISQENMEKKLYVTVMDRKKYDAIDEFMYPMFPEDLQPVNMDTSLLIEQQEAMEKIVVGTTYLAMDYLKLQEIDLTKEWEAILVTEEKRYSVKVRLAPSEKYQKVIEDLYKYYQQNNLEWVTVNAPFLKKFYDFVLVGDVSFEPEQHISRVEVALGELEQVREDRLIPFWNLERTYLTSTNFPTAMGDTLRFQHSFDLENEEEVNSYIIIFDKAHDGYVMREQQRISIIITDENISKWPVYKLHMQNKEFPFEYEYPVYSNSHKNSFMIGFAQKQRRTIRSQAELYRMLQSYEISDLFQIESIQICENSEIVAETYELNTFIEDDIRTDVKRKCLLVTAKAQEESYLSRDLLSFLISEIQYYFPEYECVGKLKKNENALEE